MVCRSKILAAALIASVAFSIQPAMAADMDGNDVYTDDANFVKPAELGSGWYMRGDVSYNFGLDQERGFDYQPIVGLPTLRYRFGDSYGYGVGVGKQLTALLRADVTVDRTASSETLYTGFRNFTGQRRFDYTYINAALEEVSETAQVIIGRDATGNLIYSNDCSGPGAAACNTSAAGLSFGIGGTEQVDMSYSIWSVLANAYVDLPTFGGFTPYVGGGAGMARPAVTLQHLVTCSANEDEACGLPAGDFGEVIEDFELVNDVYARWLPTFAVTAGASYDLTKNIKLDLGYRFQHIMNIDSVLEGASLTDTSLLNDKDSIHSVRLGVRVSTW